MCRLSLPLIAALIATGFGCASFAPDTKDGGFGSLDGTDTSGKNAATGLVDSDTAGASSGTVTPGGNNAPHADAGPDQRNVNVNSQVDLNGVGDDLDGDTLTYQWDLTTVPQGETSAQITNPTFNQATLIVGGEGIYVATLTVSDGKADDSDTVRIEVTNPNSPPKASFTLLPAGTFVLGSGYITADASATTDPDGDTLSYNWSLNQPSGGSAFLNGASNPAAAVTVSFAPTVSGLYTITLKVSDGQIEGSAPARSVTVVQPNTSSGTSSGSSSSGGSDCLDCAEPASVAAISAWRTGDLASSLGLLGLPVLLVLWHRRREDD